MKIYTGDLPPNPLELTLWYDDGTPLDITLAESVRIVGNRGLDDVTVFDRAPSTAVVVGDRSVVTMAWQAVDTEIPAWIDVQVEVIWPGGRPETFQPLEGIEVAADFDYVP